MRNWSPDFTALCSSSHRCFILAIAKNKNNVSTMIVYVDSILFLSNPHTKCEGYCKVTSLVHARGLRDFAGVS